jgi:anti-anti-sigma factor
MNTEIRQENGVYTAVLTGWLDTNEASQFMKDIQPLREHIDQKIVIDCAGLEYVCSLALRAFLTLKKESAAKGGDLQFVNISDEVHKILRLTGFLKLLGLQ